MVKARSEYNRERRCVACSIEVDGRGDIVLEEMCGIVKAFVNSNLQQAKPGHEHAVAMLIGDKIVDSIAEAAKDHIELSKKNGKEVQ